MSINSFIVALEKEDFVHAHELLEDEWREYKKLEQRDKAKAVQGLINGATALALYRKNRPEAYERVWKVFEKYKKLLDNIEINNKEKYFEARDLLEKKRVQITN